VIQVVECLPRKPDALSSNFSTPKKKKKRRKRNKPDQKRQISHGLSHMWNLVLKNE
jgi:hypothetical protein